LSPDQPFYKAYGVINPGACNVMRSPVLTLLDAHSRALRLHKLRNCALQMFDGKSVRADFPAFGWDQKGNSRDGRIGVRIIRRSVCYELNSGD
jgi:hypothetical protein